MSNEVKPTRGRKPDLKAVYGHRYKALRNAFYRHNPLRTFATNKAYYYQPIIGTILARRGEANSREALRQVIAEEFVRWVEPMYGPRWPRWTGAATKLDKIVYSAWASWNRQEAGESTMGQLTPNENYHQSEPFAVLCYEVLQIIHRHDPIGIAYQPDEYDIEVETIIPRLKEARSQEELRPIIQQEFARWFNAKMAGPESKYDAIARDIWKVWQLHNSKITQADEGIPPED